MEKRTFTLEYKTKIMLEVLEGDMLANEIAAREGVSPKQLSAWKQEFLKNAHRAFTISSDEKHLKQELKASDEREQELLAKVGVLAVENRPVLKLYFEQIFEGLYDRLQWRKAFQKFMRKEGFRTGRMTGLKKSKEVLGYEPVARSSRKR